MRASGLDGEGAQGRGPLSRAALLSLAWLRPLRRRCPETGAVGCFGGGHCLRFTCPGERDAGARPAGQVLPFESPILTRSLTSAVLIGPVRVGSRSLSWRSTGCAGDSVLFKCPYFEGFDSKEFPNPARKLISELRVQMRDVVNVILKLIFKTYGYF